MKALVSFERSFIAPCGMNCGTCIVYIRDKKNCPGCNANSAGSVITVRRNNCTACLKN